MKTCFIIMPFSKANSSNDKELNTTDLDYVYNTMIKKAVEEFEFNGERYFHEVIRYEEKVGSIIKGIIQNLKNADLVIADLTGINPNVMYELGVRHALKRGTIMLTQNFDEFPSDLRDYMTVQYNYSRDIHEQPENNKEFTKELHKTIQQLLTTEKNDSPVLEYVGMKELYKNEAEIIKLKENAVILEAIYDDCDRLEQLVSDIVIESPTLNEEVTRELIIIFLDSVHSKFSELKIPMVSSALYEDIINTKVLLTELSKTFTINEYFSQFPPEAAEVFPGSDLKSSIKKRVIDPFYIKWEENINYITIQDVFKKGGIIEVNVLSDISDYIEGEADKLGVRKEIVELLNS